MFYRIFPSSRFKCLASLRKFCSSSQSLSTPVIPTTAVTSTDSSRPSVIGSICPDPPCDEGPTFDALQTQAECLEAETHTQYEDVHFPRPPDPGMCCGTGCPNCVWIQYAEAVAEHVKEQRETQKNTTHLRLLLEDELKRNVLDENLRMYLLMEVKATGL